ncbi:MAG: M20 metallopeptidase family protein [Fusobacteriaceae bacterium]
MKSFYRKTREELHRIPELALEEYKTAQYIRDFLKNLDIQYREIGTSTVALIPGEQDRWIAYRADIDALPMREETGADYRSQHDGCMHACGHDAHVTNLLYFAKWLKENRDRGMPLHKSVMLIFQAAEEGEGGAKVIAEDPLYRNREIEGIFALHVYPEIPEGKASTLPGPMTYQSINLDIKILGKGCHGAQPFKGIDSILIGAKLVEAYQSIVSRNIDSEEPIVLTIGSFHAGTVRNIIPEKVELLGTIRLINRNLIPLVQKRIEDINEGFQKAFGVKIEMNFQPNYPGIVNSSELFKVFEKAVPEESRYSGMKLSGSEDFSFYMEEGVPGLMFLLGTGNREKGFDYALHNSKFDLDPEELTLGFEIFKNLLQEMEGI